MKKHLFICFLLIAKSVLAQESAAPVFSVQPGVDSMIYKKGKSLRRTGIFLSVAGGALVVTGVVLNVSGPVGIDGDDPQNASVALMVGGGVTCVIGLIMLWEAKNKMKRSGVKMSLFQYGLPPGPGISKIFPSAGIAIRL